MSERLHLAEMIEAHFSEPKGSTFANFISVTDGLTAAQAATAPGERLNSIWAVVNHIAFWQDFATAGLQGKALNLNEWGMTEIGNGWPPPKARELTQANWLAVRQRALDGNRAFAQAIRALTDEQMTQEFALLGSQAYRVIYSTFAHNSYHTAEILTIRHRLKLWVEHPWA